MISDESQIIEGKTPVCVCVRVCSHTHLPVCVRVGQIVVKILISELHLILLLQLPQLWFGGRVTQDGVRLWDE